MKIKGIIETDLINYKLPCMTIEMPICKGFKCDKECGERVCQNSDLASVPDIDYPVKKIVSRYLGNPITQAIVFQGLEPFDSYEDLLRCITEFRSYTNDPIVIYTGYTESEINNDFTYTLYRLKRFSNIIIKFGRYIPNHNSRYEPLLGVRLASDNQYAKEIS